MRLLYATSISLPSKLANRRQIVQMAAAFTRQFSDKDFFLLTTGQADTNELHKLSFPTIQLSKKTTIGRAAEILGIVDSRKIEKIYCREEILAVAILFLGAIHKKPIHLYFEHHWIAKNLRVAIAQFILARFAKGHVFVTQNLKSRFLKRYPVKNKESCVVAHDAVDLDFFHMAISKEDARLKLGISKDSFVLAYSGRFSTMGVEKGIGDVLEAIALIPNNNVLFMAVGAADSKEIAHFESEARKNGVSALFIGYVPQEQLRDHLAAADAFVMPFPDTPHYRYDMSPLKLFEYMAMNRPIIASDLDSIREVLDDQSAFFFQPADSKSLSRAILSLKENESSAKEKAGKSFALADSYTWSGRAREILDFMNFSSR